MNLWECGHVDVDGKRCKSTAVGTGGAIGLRAVGWFFNGTGHLYCPAHRPDKAVVKTEGCGTQGPCSMCSAEADAALYQLRIIEDLAGKGVKTPLDVEWYRKQATAANAH